MSPVPAIPLPNRIVILHGATGQPIPPDEQDVLHQVDATAGALRRLGYEAVALGVSLDFRRMAAALTELRPAGVFNLVESLEGQGRFASLAPALLEALRIPYTGCPAAALHQTTDKLIAKRRMADAGLPTPAWLAPHEGPDGTPFQPGRWILKPVCEDASIGLDASAVVCAHNAPGLRHALQHREALVDLELFAEVFVEGREIRIALIAGPDGVDALPPSEILFVDFPMEQPRILDYRAKWEKESFEYAHTPWSVEFPPADAPLLAELTDLARRCWELFGLRGYARIDFRVDAGGRPWVLEVNGNPCLTPDAGFIAVACHHGKDFEWVIRRILESAQIARLGGDA
jgi:D-alanine-D-alanine ligase